MSVRLREYNGHQPLDVRVFEPDSTGKLKASTRGIAISVQKIDELIKGIEQARGEFARGELLRNVKVQGISMTQKPILYLHFT